jgi:hypothetical protein
MNASKWIKGMMAAAAVAILLGGVGDPFAGSSTAAEAATLVISGPATDNEAAMLVNVDPLATEMLDNAIESLSRGLARMEADDRRLFLKYFDPGQTGQVDERFVEAALENYLQIRGRFDRPIKIEFKTESDMCIGQRLFYTDMFKVYVCPAFSGDQTDTRRARDLVHEVSHIALKVLDRPYYAPKSGAYAELAPWGSPLAQVPVVGPVVREVLRSDTLYHPDAYAWYASSIGSRPTDAIMME